MDPDAFSQLVGAIYDATVDDAQWSGVLSRMGELLNSPFGLLQSLDGDTLASNFHLTVGYDESLLELYQQHAHDDPFMREVARFAVGAVFTDDRLPGAGELRRSAIYHDYYALTEQEHVVGAVLVREQQRSMGIGLRRPARSGPFSDEERRFVARLLPHVLRSFQLRRQLHGARLALNGMGEAIARMHYAAVLVDREARVLERNVSARLLLAGRDGLSEQGGRLAAAESRAGRALHRAIAATAGSAVPPASAVLRVPRPSGRRSYAVLVAPLPARKAWGLADKALVLIRDPNDSPRPAVDAIAVLHGLTPAEARLAAALAGGENLREHADLAGITLNTARWTLKRVLAKTDARSQSDLVRLLLTSPASLRVDGDG